MNSVFRSRLGTLKDTRPDEVAAGHTLPATFTIQEASAAFDIPERAIRELIRRGRLSAFRTGPRRIRIRREALLELVDGRGDHAASRPFIGEHARSAVGDLDFLQPSPGEGRRA